MLDVLLIHPPTRDYSKLRASKIDNTSYEIEFPIGLTYIGTVLKNHGYSVRIADFEILKWSSLHIKALYENHRPKIIGFGATSISYSLALKFASEFKKIDPDLPVIIGGVHSTLFPLEVMKNECVDYVAVGEGEYTMLELTQYLLDNKGQIENIKGLLYKCDGIVKINDPRPVEQDLDKFPIPDRNLLIKIKDVDYFSVAAKKNPIDAIITNRGCPFQCSFCCRIFKTPRFRSAANIIEEIKYLNALGIKDIQIRDNTFNLNKKKNIELCRLIIKENIDINWRALCRPDLLDEELVRYYKRSGCYMISMGVESGSDRILEILKKGYNKQQIRNAFSLLKKYDIETHAYFIMGIPEESIEDIHATFRFMHELAPLHASIQIYTPIPGNEIYHRLIDQGVIDKDLDFSKLRGMDHSTFSLPQFPDGFLTKFRFLKLSRFYYSLTHLKLLGMKFAREPHRWIKNVKKLMKFWLVG